MESGPRTQEGWWPSHSRHVTDPQRPIEMLRWQQAEGEQGRPTLRHIPPCKPAYYSLTFSTNATTAAISSLWTAPSRWDSVQCRPLRLQKQRICCNHTRLDWIKDWQQKPEVRIQKSGGRACIYALALSRFRPIVQNTSIRCRVQRHVCYPACCQQLTVYITSSYTARRDEGACGGQCAWTRLSKSAVATNSLCNSQSTAGRAHSGYIFGRLYHDKYIWGHCCRFLPVTSHCNQLTRGLSFLFCCCTNGS